MKAKDILSRLPMGGHAPAPAAAAEPRAPRAASAPIPIVGEIETMHRGAIAELKDLKARRLIALELQPGQIDVGPFRDRDYRFLVDEAFEDLVESIRREGQLQAILVRRRPSAEPAYELIVGLRRLKACERLGIPVLAKEIDADDRATVLAMIAENELREDISAVERSRQIKALLETGLLSQTEIASVLGRHKSLISRLLALADIPPAILLAIGDPRAMPLRVGYTIAQLCRHPLTLRGMLAVAEELAGKENAGSTVQQRLEALVAAADRATEGQAEAVRPVGQPVAKAPPRARLPDGPRPALQLCEPGARRPLVSLTAGGPRTGAVIRLAPDLGPEFVEALMRWARDRLTETGRPVEFAAPGAPPPKLPQDAP